MKRREFFTKVALGTAAVAVAPHILGQDPKALNPYRNVLNNPYYKWVKAKRSDVHVKDNNYWQCLSEEAAINKKAALDRSFIQMVIYGETHDYHRIYPVQFREYDWVYQGAWIESYDPRIGINPKGIHWMNVEDFAFYNDLYDKKVFDPHYSNLLGVGLIPKMRDPITLEFTGIKNGIMPYCAEGNSGYEIHIMYQKIK